jgi:hypothetical protein
MQVFWEKNCWRVQIIREGILTWFVKLEFKNLENGWLTITIPNIFCKP